MTTEMIFTAACAVIIIIMVRYYSKRPNRLISVLFGSVSGAAALMFLSRYGGTVGIIAVRNIFDIAGSVILGIPYVICIAIMNFL